MESEDFFTGYSDPNMHRVNAMLPVNLVSGKQVMRGSRQVTGELTAMGLCALYRMLFNSPIT